MTTSVNDLQDNVFLYTTEEFFSLQQAYVATSIISLVWSVIVALVYIFMLIYHRQKANRVSLRCVFLCCLSETLSSIMSIIVTTDKIGVCTAANIVLGFSSIFSSAALTIVGLNLLLVFVINVKRRNFLEKIYYPSLVVYSLVGAFVPIYQYIGRGPAKSEKYSCWYVTYVQGRSYNNLPYIWFYVFIFFINIVAVVCSVIAMIKLLMEHGRMKNKIDTIATNSNASINQQLGKSLEKNHSSILSRVVLRCAIYPLVPFISDIFGFIMELIIYGGHTPGFVLAMFDAIFSKIEGFLVALVFFSDPAVTLMMGENYKACYQKYVVEYTLMSKEEIENMQSIRNRLQQAKTTYSSSLTSCHSGINIIKECQYRLQVPESVANIDRPNRGSNTPNGKVRPSIFIDEREETCSQQAISKNQEFIAIRRINMYISEKTKDNVGRNRKTSNSSSNIRTSLLLTNAEFNEHGNIRSTSSTNEAVYVRYQYPIIATIIHHFMCFFGCKKPDNGRRDSEVTMHYDHTGGMAFTTSSAEEEKNIFGEQSNVRQSVGSSSGSGISMFKY